LIVTDVEAVGEFVLLPLHASVNVAKSLSVREPGAFGVTSSSPAVPESVFTHESSQLDALEEFHVSVYDCMVVCSRDVCPFTSRVRVGGDDAGRSPSPALFVVKELSAYASSPVVELCAITRK
jgi:hypothetical protein